MRFNVPEKLNGIADYDFLAKDERLGDNLCILCFGGSYAYGTNTPTSDIDVRGVALPSKKDILVRPSFEQVIDNETDTVIYSFDKILSLLAACNPNTIEMLGCKDYLYISDVGKEILSRKSMFLSKRAVNSFGGYANQQLRRLENKSNLTVGHSEQEQHLLKTIINASYEFREKYFEFPDDAIRLYVDASDETEWGTDIFMDVFLEHYPLRDCKGMWSEVSNIIRSYDKIGQRNLNAMEHKKLGKHMMHLVRLYLMAFDILERGEIITYRDKERDWLMDIRNGKYLDGNDRPTKEFRELVDELEARLQYDKETSELPDKPDMDAIDKLRYEVKSSIIRENFL